MNNGQAGTILRHIRKMARGTGERELPDRELLQRFTSRRDEAAFATLLRRHGELVWAVCRRVLGHEQDAEDAFQATFLVLARKASSIRKEEALAAWLYGVAFRTAMAARKSSARRSERERQARIMPRTQSESEPALRELQVLLDEEVSRLPEKYRAAFVLCCLQGKSKPEAAQALGWKEGTVSSRLAQARKLLQRRLTRRGVTLSAALCATALSPSTASAALLKATTKAALLFTTGKAAGWMSAPAAALAEGVIKAMFVTKVKAGLGLVLALSLLAAGAGLAAHQTLAQKPATPTSSDAAQPTAKSAEPPKPEETKRERTDLHGDPLPEGAAMRLGTIQRRAVGAQLAVSADGKSIIGVRGGRYITVWDAETGNLRERRTVAGNVGSRYGGVGWGFFVLSHDGSRLVTQDVPNGRIIVWDTRTGKQIRTFAIKGSDIIVPAIFSPDGKSLAGVGHAGYERTIKVWNVQTGEEILSKSLRSRAFSCNHLVFTPDNKRLLGSFISPEDGTFCWEIATGKMLWQNKEFMPNSLVISPHGKIYSSMTRFPALDLATGQPVDLEKKPPISPLGDTRLALTPDGRTLLTSTAERVIVWDLNEGKELRTLTGAGEEVVVAPDSKTIFTNNGSLQRWDLATGKPLYADTFEQGHIGEVVSVLFSADGKRLASASADGSVRLWDATTGKPLRVWRAHAAQRPPIGTLALAKAGVEVLDLSADGRWAISAGGGDSFKLFDAATANEVRTIPLPKPQPNELRLRIFRLRFSPDAATSVCLFADGGTTPRPEESPPITYNVATWDLKTGQLLRVHPVEVAHATSSDDFVKRSLSPDGRSLVSNGMLIDVASGREVVRLESGAASARAGQPVAFSKDGTLVAGGFSQEKNGYFSPDGVRIWEAASGKTVAHLNTKWWPGQVAFHPNNRFVATNDYGGVRVWDAITGKVVASRQMPEELRGSMTIGSYASCLDVSPDGRRLATGHPDGTILLWDIPLPKDRPEPLSKKELESLWADLIASDAAKAWRAVWRLADSPSETLPLLRKNLKPAVALPGDVTRPLLADLDDNSFQRREEAVKRLKELGHQAGPALRKALKSNLSAEQRRRIEEVLASLAAPPPPAADLLRQLRAVTILERIGKPEAQNVLKALAKGAPEDRLTQEVKAALERLGTRGLRELPAKGTND